MYSSPLYTSFPNNIIRPIQLVLVRRLLTHILFCFCLLKLRVRCSSPSRSATSVSLVGDTDDTAGRTSSGVACLLGLLVSALAEVVGAGVDDDGAL